MDAYTYKTARILISKFGDGAIQQALERQLSCLNNGDTEGFVRWGGAVEAIEQLRQGDPGEKEKAP